MDANEHSGAVERYEKDLRAYADDSGVVAAADSPRGPWSGPAPAVTQLLEKLWDQWAELELERAEVWAKPRGPALAAAKQAVVLRLLGGAAAAVPPAGELPGVSAFVDLQRAHFRNVSEDPLPKFDRTMSDEQLRRRALDRFRQEQLFLFADYARQLEANPPESATARRALRLQQVLLVTPSGERSPRPDASK